MRNRDMPATPIQLDSGEVWSEEQDHANGLTKREYAAIKIMAGFVSSNRILDGNNFAGASVELADMLFEHLEGIV